jgi:hypothetical protein
MSTITDLTNELNATLADNTTRQITPAKMRTLLIDLITRIESDVGAGGGTPSPTPTGTPTSLTALYGDNSWKEPTVNTDHITATGTPNSSTILYGDNAWRSAPGGTSITGGGLGFNFDSRAAAASASIATTGAGGPNWIRTNGYAAAGDGGGALYVRIGSTPAYSSLIWFTSADGQKWGIVNKNEPYRIEQAGGGTGMSGAANNAAVDAIHSIFYTNKFGFGYGYAGPNIKLGYGIYNFATPWFVKGTSNISGVGSGMFGGYATELKFPANCDGIVCGAPGTNGRLYNPGAYGDYDARGTVIRDLKISGGWDTVESTMYSVKRDGTGSRGNGILAKCGLKLENLYINRFAEMGVYTKGTIGGGGSASEPAFGTGDNIGDPTESYVCAEGSANNFTYIAVGVEVCGCDGFRDRGADANAGSYISCSASVNAAWGFNGLCFLGNYYFGCHSATNGGPWYGQGKFDWNSGKSAGAYQAWSESNYTSLIACYSEAGQAASVLNGYSMIWGGLHAAGSPTQGPFGWYVFSQGPTAHLSPISVGTTAYSGQMQIGNSNVGGEVYNIDTGDGGIFFRAQFGRYDMGSFANPSCFALTTDSYGWSMGRASTIGVDQILLPRGFFLGSPGIGSEGEMRFRGVHNGLPTSGKWGQGDHIDIINPSAGGAWGYVCTTSGDYAGTPPVWKSKGNLSA